MYNSYSESIETGLEDASDFSMETLEQFNLSWLNLMMHPFFKGYKQHSLAQQTGEMISHRQKVQFHQTPEVLQGHISQNLSQGTEVGSSESLGRSRKGWSNGTTKAA